MVQNGESYSRKRKKAHAMPKRVKGAPVDTSSGNSLADLNRGSARWRVWKGSSSLGGAWRSKRNTRGAGNGVSFPRVYNTASFNRVRTYSMVSWAADFFLRTAAWPDQRWKSFIQYG